MVAGLVLAAGESSRMGTDKALLAYRGRTFIESIVRTLRAADLDRVVVVLGHHAELVQKTARLAGAEIVVNSRYLCGQTSSLRAGLDALERPDLEAVLLCLVDHPVLSEEVVRRLTEAFRRDTPAAVIPTFQGRSGHPVLIGRALCRELSRLGDEVGANVVLRAHRQATRFLEVPDAGILVDVDDPPTYRRLLETEASAGEHAVRPPLSPQQVDEPLEGARGENARVP